MMYIFHNSADTDEMPLFGSSLFAKVPVYYYCLPVSRLKSVNQHLNNKNLSK